MDSVDIDLRQCVVHRVEDPTTASPVAAEPARGPRWAMLCVAGLATARAVGGHLVLPLVLVVRGLPFLGLVLIRPNEATLAIGGAQASAGQLPWTLLFLAAVLGAVLSDVLSYALGRTAGEAALSRLLSHRRGHGRMGRMVQRSRRVVERHGSLAVAGARPTVITHGVVPVLAGMGRMPAVRFFAAATAGAAAWAAMWLGGAAVASDVLRRGGGGLLIALLGVLAVGVGLAVRECLRRPACLRHAS